MNRFYVHFCTFAIHWTDVCVSVLCRVLLITRTRLYIAFLYYLCTHSYSSHHWTEDGCIKFASAYVCVCVCVCVCGHVCMFVCKRGQWEKSEEVDKICRPEVLTVMLLRIRVFRNVTFCWLSGSWCFKCTVTHGTELYSGTSECIEIVTFYTYLVW